MGLGLSGVVRSVLVSNFAFSRIARDPHSLINTRPTLPRFLSSLPEPPSQHERASAQAVHERVEAAPFDRAQSAAEGGFEQAEDQSQRSERQVGR